MPLMRRNDFRRLARARAVDAQALLAAGRFPAAYYVAGYAVECAIKACIANQTRQYEFPDWDRTKGAYQHDFDKLLKTVPTLDRVHKHDWAANARFRAFWTVVVQWTVDSRYDLSIVERQARDMVEAVTDRPDGVLEWFQHHWHL